MSKTSENVSIEASRRHLDLGLLLALTLLLIYLFFEPLRKVWDIAQVNDDYSHGMLLPVVSAYIFWDRRSKIKKLWAERHNHSPGLVKILISSALLIIGGVLFVGWALSGLTYVGWLGFFFMLAGSLIISLEKKWLALVLEPILLLFMAHPLPASLVPRLFNPLQQLAAKSSEVCLDLLGVPVYVQGNIIEIPGMRLLVEEACSGLRSVLAMATVAVIMPMLFRMTHVARASLFAIAIVIALVLNIARVVVTGVLAYFYDKSVAEGFFHDFTGMIVFIIGISIVYTALHYLITDEKAPVKDQEGAPSQ